MNDKIAMIHLSLAIFLLFLFSGYAKGGETIPFDFAYAGNQLRGMIELPQDGESSSLIIIVHGHGRTNAQNGQWMDLRTKFPELGITTVLWDKAGCGNSEGEYDHNQSVQSSAQEALAAIEELRRKNVPGVEKIGLWGISRAGWICPLVIKKDPSIAFWISVSGTDDKENFGYLLESNFRIEGRSESRTQLLVSEWSKGNDIIRKGGSFEEYQETTLNLRRDPFWLQVSGAPYAKVDYQRWQKKFISENHEFDEATGLMIYIPRFREVLSAISCPVLAIFGEKDTNVNWKNTAQLYREAFSEEQLRIKRFPDGNHNLQKSETGGWNETIRNRNRWNPCDGYYDTMIDWLKDIDATKVASESVDATSISVPLHD